MTGMIKGLYWVSYFRLIKLPPKKDPYVGILEGIQNKLKIRDTLRVVPLKIFMARKFGLGFFGASNFSPGIFWGFCLKP